MVYTLDLETMRQMMQKYKKTGHLHADLPSGVPSLREPCHVEIALNGGNIVSCSITSRHGILITGDKAYRELTRLERIKWTFAPPSPPAKQLSIAMDALGNNVIVRPYHLVAVETQQMRSWPQMHKLVYGCIDGTRSVVEIAELLSTTPKNVEDVLRDLRSIRVVEVK